MRALHQDFIYTLSSWFDRKYASKLSARFPTRKAALNIALQRVESPILVETGCIRLPEDWGAGFSTYVFAETLWQLNTGHLYSVDVNADNVRFCHQTTQQFAARRTCVCDESLHFVAHTLPTYTTRIDLLYLDSYDYPIDKLFLSYAATMDEGEKLFMQDSDEAVLRKFAEYIVPCQMHCLKELQLAEHMISPTGVVLIDDCAFPGGGKGRLAKEYLASRGWLCILDCRQSLWTKY